MAIEQLTFILVAVLVVSIIVPAVALIFAYVVEAWRRALYRNSVNEQVAEVKQSVGLLTQSLTDNWAKDLNELEAKVNKIEQQEIGSDVIKDIEKQLEEMETKISSVVLSKTITPTLNRPQSDFRITPPRPSQE